MCQNCKASEEGIKRQQALEEATAKCKELNINPATIGFLVKHAYQGRVPGGQRLNATAEQIEAVKEYNTAYDAMKKLHEDHVWTLAHKDAEDRRVRGVKPFYVTHGDKR